MALICDGHADALAAPTLDALAAAGLSATTIVSTPPPVTKPAIRAFGGEGGPDCLRRNAMHAVTRGGEGGLAAGLKVVLFHPTPEAGWDVPRSHARRVMEAPRTAGQGAPAAAFDARYDAVMAALDRIEHPNLRRVRPHEALCEEGGLRCSTSTTTIFRMRARV